MSRIGLSHLEKCSISRQGDVSDSTTCANERMQTGLSLACALAVGLLAVSCASPQRQPVADNRQAPSPEIGNSSEASPVGKVPPAASPRSLRIAKRSIQTQSETFISDYFAAECTSLRILANKDISLKLKLSKGKISDAVFVSLISDGVSGNMNAPTRKSTLERLDIALSPDDGGEYVLVSYAGLNSPVRSHREDPIPNIREERALYVSLKFARVNSATRAEYSIEPLVLDLPIFVYTRSRADEKWPASAIAVNIQIPGIRNVIEGGAVPGE